VTVVPKTGRIVVMRGGHLATCSVIAHSAPSTVPPRYDQRVPHRDGSMPPRSLFSSAAKSGNQFGRAAHPTMAAAGHALMPRCGLGLAAEPGLLPGLLEPLAGTTDPALTARLASPATVDEPTTELDRFTAHAACSSLTWEPELAIRRGQDTVPRGTTHCTGWPVICAISS
jgi:hypothetical protein